jgi:predicted ArsR family transcriptional regulator
VGASLAEYVKKNPGQRGEQIAEALGTDTKPMRLPMQRLIADGAVRTKGERRGMRYFPV